MKILFLEQCPRPVGGSERMAFTLCRHVLSRGHQAWLAYASPGELVAAYESAGARCRQLPVFTIAIREPRTGWQSYRSLAALVRSERIDVVFTSQVSYASLMALVGVRTGARTVMHLGLTYDFPSPIFRHSIRLIDAGVVPSIQTADGWRARAWPARSLHVIPNGVDTKTFTPGDGREAARGRLGIPAGADPLIAYVGRLVREKGIFTLMRAFARLRRRGGLGRLMFVGMAPGDEATELERVAREEDVAASVWHVRPPMSTPEDAYRAADIVVVPSEWEEPFGLAPLEAMACGTFVIVSDRGLLPTFVEPVGGDAVFPSGHVERLADRLAEWLGHPMCREAAAARLAAHARAEYAVERCGDAYLEVFNDLVRQ